MAEPAAQTTVRVVLAERDPLLRVRIAEMLRDGGFQLCGVAESKQELILVAAATQPDLFLIDSHLGAANHGFEAAEWILVHHDVAVVLMAGPGDPPSVVPFVAKPFDRDRLFAEITRAMALRVARKPCPAGQETCPFCSDGLHQPCPRSEEASRRLQPTS